MNKKIKWSLALVIGMGLALSVSTRAQEADEIPDDPALPRVVIVGDSIGQNYTPYVRELLKGKANVHVQSVAATRGGVRIAGRTLERGPWDLIFFNIGLWDMAYRKGKLTAGLPVYERNLRATVAKLQEANTKLLFATTTPVPDGTGIRIEGDEKNYNEVAVKVMHEMGVPVLDLHAHAALRPDLQRSQNVHYGKEGYQYLAEAVAAAIEKALNGN